MRFALVATAAAAAVAVPFAVAAGAPQMSSDQFLTAVRCVAYADVSGAGVNDAKLQLNAEARRQSPQTVLQAQAEASTIARQASAGELAQDHAAVCAREHLATATDSRRSA